MSDPALPEFIPGLLLSQRFYREVVAPILARDFPRLAHSACLIGYGSDVIGLDTPMSRDHMWGPRLVLFLPEDGFEETRAALDAVLRADLPRTFLGYPTGFGPPDDEGVRLLRFNATGPVDHLIELRRMSDYFYEELAFVPRRDPTEAEWLSFAEHRLLSLTAGGVWRDDLGLEAWRARLAAYPRDVWLYRMACEWSRIGQEEPFVGRAGTVGDDLGSRVLAARLAQVCMRLAFHQARRYPPYSKWFGSAFARLEGAGELKPALETALAAAEWQAREAALGQACEALARRHNALGLTPALEPVVSPFHGRPYRVIHAERFAAALQEQIASPFLRRLPLIGAVNQISDSSDFLENRDILARMREVYDR